MISIPRRIAVAALAFGFADQGLAQEMPTSQPALINIVREDVKVGQAAAHSRFEAGWPAALTKAKWPDYYLAYVSMTGPSEAWYVAPFASNAAFDERMKREAGQPALSAELQRLSAGDAVFLNDVRVMQAAGRPDLSFGAFPDLGKVRFTEITWFRVRPGHEQGFEAAAKAYRGMVQRAGATTGYRVYQITAGIPGPTYLVFSSVESYAGFDQIMAADQGAMRGATPDEMNTLQKFSADGLINTETQRFRVDPAQSYVSPEARAADPAFWTPKKTPVRP